MVRFDPDVPRRYLSGHLLWFLTWLFVTGFALYLQPSSEGHGTHTQLGLPPCPSVYVFGRLCPGCGLTTSITATVKGMFVEAWRANPFGLIAYPFFSASALACLFGFVTKKRFNTDSRVFQWLLGSFIAAYMVFGAWRLLTQTVTR